jgi:hypothetical protein
MRLLPCARRAASTAQRLAILQPARTNVSQSDIKPHLG